MKTRTALCAIVAAACLYALLHSIDVARRSDIELQAPTQASIARHYSHTERALQAIGEGATETP